MAEWKGKQVGKDGFGVRSLRLWQDINGRQLEKQDWGLWKSEGKEGLGSGRLLNALRKE